MILIIHPELALAQPLMETIAPCKRLWEIEDLDAFVTNEGQDVRAFACIGGKHTPASLFDLFPELEAVIAAGVGVDGVDLQAAKAKNIAVCNSPGINTDDVADLAMGLLIAGERNIIELDGLVRRGEWADALSHAPRYRLRGRTIGYWAGDRRAGRSIWAERDLAWPKSQARSGLVSHRKRARTG
jgi:lactate dehydrogenase-like 2-hydroxyacid dehydrogenase